MKRGVNYYVSEKVNNIYIYEMTSNKNVNNAKNIYWKDNQIVVISVIWHWWYIFSALLGMGDMRKILFGTPTNICNSSGFEINVDFNNINDDVFNYFDEIDDGKDEKGI